MTARCVERSLLLSVILLYLSPTIDNFRDNLASHRSLKLSHLWTCLWLCHIWFICPQSTRAQEQDFPRVFLQSLSYLDVISIGINSLILAEISSVQSSEQSLTSNNQYFNPQLAYRFAWICWGPPTCWTACTKTLILRTITPPKNLQPHRTR